MKPAVFLDRDGTVIREVEYLSRLADLELLPGVAEALVRLGDAGFARVLVTNQSGVARGYFDEGFVEKAHLELRSRLQADGADLEGWYVCPHHPDLSGPCGCRKPSPGLVERAAVELDLDLGRSWVVGDKSCDLDLARACGCRGALVRTGYGRETEWEPGCRPDLVADDLAGIVEEILKT